MRTNAGPGAGPVDIQGRLGRVRRHRLFEQVAFHRRQAGEREVAGRYHLVAVLVNAL